MRINEIKFKPVIKAGVIPYFKYQNKFFVGLVYSSNPKFGGYYPQIAKGKVDKKDNNLLDAAFREFNEETGILREDAIHVFSLKPKKIESIDGHTNEKLQSLLYTWAAEYKEKQPFVKNKEIRKMEWFEIHEAINKIRPEQTKILKDLKRKLS